jgi:hypothetical protein
VNSILQLGLDTFGDVTVGDNGMAKSHAQVIRDVIDEAVLADELGTPSRLLCTPRRRVCAQASVNKLEPTTKGQATVGWVIARRYPLHRSGPSSAKVAMMASPTPLDATKY